MTTEVAKVALTEDEAMRLTTRIELRMGTIADNVDAVMTMVQQARDGNAHLALGYRSWTEYVEDKFGGQLGRLTRADRPQLVELLSGQGMSTRSIAGTLGVSKNTVTADLSQIGTPGQTTGKDGKTYPRPEPRPDTRETADVPTEAELGARLADLLEGLYADDPEAYQVAHDIAPTVRVLWPWTTRPQHVTHRAVAYEIFRRCMLDSPVWDVMNPWLYVVASQALLEYDDLDAVDLPDVGDWPPNFRWPGRSLAELCQVVCNPDLSMSMQVSMHKQFGDRLAMALVDSEKWVDSAVVERCNSGGA